MYLAYLRGIGPQGSTLAILKAPGGDKAVVLRFQKAQLPCFTLWKNTRGLREGYVTGLEPATNFPNPKPVEAARGRVVPLPPGGTFVAETTLEWLDGLEAVAAVEAEIQAHPGPRPAHDPLPPRRTLHPRRLIPSAGLMPASHLPGTRSDGPIRPCSQSHID